MLLPTLRASPKKKSASTLGQHLPKEEACTCANQTPKSPHRVGLFELASRAGLSGPLWDARSPWEILETRLRLQLRLASLGLRPSSSALHLLSGVESQGSDSQADPVEIRADQKFSRHWIWKIREVCRNSRRSKTRSQDKCKGFVQEESRELSHNLQTSEGFRL